MLMIRLQRVGRKHEPVFRVVVTESQNSTKSGRFLEVVGSYDPRHKDKTIIEKDRITHWISKGAKPSDTLHNMFVSMKIIEGKKINVLPKKTPIKKESGVKSDEGGEMKEEKAEEATTVEEAPKEENKETVEATK